MMSKNKKVREQMKNRAEKIRKFRFKMNFGLDSGACRDVGASHSLCLNELFQRAGSVLEVSRSVISGLFASSAVRRATLSTAIKADDHAGRVFPRPVYHGASGGIAEMNCFNSSGVTPAVMMFWSALIGSMERNKAVLMMVMAMETFFLPCAVRLPKVILRKSTAFLIPCSARLFVGSIAGYFRKTKSSSLNVISRLRMLSASWSDSGCDWRNFLNLLSISFRAERYASAVNAEYWL